MEELTLEEKIVGFFFSIMVWANLITLVISVVHLYQVSNGHLNLSKSEMGLLLTSLMGSMLGFIVFIMICIIYGTEQSPIVITVIGLIWYVSLTFFVSCSLAVIDKLMIMGLALIVSIGYAIWYGWNQYQHNQYQSSYQNFSEHLTEL